MTNTWPTMGTMPEPLYVILIGFTFILFDLLEPLNCRGATGWFYDPHVYGLVMANGTLSNGGRTVYYTKDGIHFNSISAPMPEQRKLPCVVVLDDQVNVRTLSSL